MKIGLLTYNLPHHKTKKVLEVLIKKAYKKIKLIFVTFKKYKKRVKISYQKSKLINQYPYTISNSKFSHEAFKLKAKISNDIKLTLKQFRQLSNEL